MDKTQNNINSLEEIKRAFFTNFASLMLDEEDYEVETDDVTVLVWNFFEPYLLITTHEQQAVERFVDYLFADRNGKYLTSDIVNWKAIILECKKKFLEENPSA